VLICEEGVLRLVLPREMSSAFVSVLDQREEMRVGVTTYLFRKMLRSQSVFWDREEGRRFARAFVGRRRMWGGLAAMLVGVNNEQKEHLDD
jgi:hypothetical protein